MAGGQAPGFFAAVQYENDRYDEVVDFFNEWTAQDGRDWRFDESTTDGMRAASWLTDDAGIAVADCGSITGPFTSVCVTVDQF